MMSRPTSPFALRPSQFELSKTRLRREGLTALRGARTPRTPLDGNPDEIDDILFSDPDAGEVDSGAAIEEIACFDENLEEVIESNRSACQVGRYTAQIAAACFASRERDSRPAGRGSEKA